MSDENVEKLAEFDAPYRRKVITFKNELDRTLGLDTVRVDKVRPDKSGFEKRFEPSHPAADADGYVLAPNVNTLVDDESSDMGKYKTGSPGVALHDQFADIERV